MAKTVLTSKRVNGEDCSDKTVFTYGFKKPNGSSALVYWNSTPILTSTYYGTASFTTFGLDTSELRLVDLTDGSIYELSENMINDNGYGSYTLINLPITHNPMMLTFGDFLCE